MSSPEDNAPLESLVEKSAKKRRVRACDQCRRRKVKCDGGEVRGRKCSNCVTFKYECTYLAGTDKRFCDVDYVRNLELELADTRQVVRRLQMELATRPQKVTSDSNTLPLCTTRHHKPQLPSTIYLTPDVQDSFTDDLDDHECIVDNFKNLNVDAQQTHFLGRSSTLMLIRTAIDMKQEYEGAVCPIEAKDSTGRPSRRPEFWDVAAEILMQPDPPYKDFPEPLLMAELLEEFFLHLNSNFPLIHRPTFAKNLASGLHLRDEGFGAVVLLMCAIGARFSNNAATIVNGFKNWHWAGWQYFQQVRSARKLIPFKPTTLFDLQVELLSAAYVAASAVPHSTYAIIGHGLRLAQDLGAHRRTTYPIIPTIESEQRKRAFWCLVAMDRGMCSVLGRPCSLQDEDFDVDLPIECDDEYWVNDDPALAFKQPPGKPSTAAFFNCCLRLGRLHAYTLRTIYSLRGVKLSQEQQKAQEIVSELDSELNKFIDSIPEHLKWDPNQPNLIFSNQSAMLYSSYYSLQIVVHRPFIPLPRKPSPLSFPSLAICTNAARSCIHILDRQYHRIGSALFHHWHQMPLFTSAIVLLLNIWSSRRFGAAVDTVKEMEEIGKVGRMLTALEPRWNTAGRFVDILRELATGAGVTAMNCTLQSQKRRREEGAESASRPTSSFAPGNSEPRNIAGSKRAELYQQSTLSSSENDLPIPNFFDTDFEFSLPVHSEDLGRIPVSSGLTSFDFSSAGSNDWSNVGSGSFNGDTTLNAPIPMANDGLQANGLDAIFNGFLPGTTYEEAFAAFTQSSPALARQIFGGVGPGNAVPPGHGGLHPGSAPHVGGQSHRSARSHGQLFSHDAPQLWDMGSSGATHIGGWAGETRF